MMNLLPLLAPLRPLIELFQDADNVSIDAITIDSRQARPGALFVAMRGARVDGHDFLPAVLDAGASAVLVERARAHEVAALIGQRPCALLTAEEPRAALGPLAAHFYGAPAEAMTMIGVTGTNGKTSTTYMIEAILRAQGHHVGVIGTVEYRWGSTRQSAPNTTPESLTLQRLLAQMRDDGVTHVVMEVSSHGLVTHRLEGTRFDVAIFTNLTQDHLDFHGTMQAYRDAKARLFNHHLRFSSARPHAIFNVDDMYAQGFMDELNDHFKDQVELHSYALDHEAASYRGRLVEGRRGVAFGLSCGGEAEREVIELGTSGKHNASNALAAIAASRAVGATWEACHQGLEGFVGAPGRMQRVNDEASWRGPTVYVDYAHTPDALERALEASQPVGSGRCWVVFGCGGERDREKRPQMGAVAARGAQVVVVTSDNPRGELPEAIMDEIVAGMGEVKAYRIADRRAAIEQAIWRAGEGDVVLIAGKGHEPYQEIGGQRLAFDDVEVAREALGLRRARISEWGWEQIASGAGGELVGRGEAPRAVISDSRQACRGALFVALEGERFDGHRFVEQVLEGGAAGVMVRRDEVSRGARVVVAETLAGLQRLGASVWREAGIDGVAVTGSNGKTTTKELLRCLWGIDARVYATGGNYNNHIGLPLTLANMPAGAQRVVLEMGANKQGDIEELIAMAPTRVRIITSIGAAHLEGFGSIDGIRRAKSEIMWRSDEQTVSLLPYSERDLLYIPDDYQGRIWTFGIDPASDVQVLRAGAVGAWGSEIELRWPGGQGVFRVPLHGSHHATNLAAAIGTMVASGWEVDVARVNEALARLEVPGGRWRVERVGEQTFVDDAYNANPSNVYAALYAFATWEIEEAGGRVAVLGEMLELGADAQVLHEEVARVASGLIGAGKLDQVVFVGRWATAQRAAAGEGSACVAVEDVEEAAQKVAQWGRAVVLLKASRGAQLERVLRLVKAAHGSAAKD
jgi:murE/murF fusion protein